MEVERAAGVQIECARHRLPGRPGVEAPPLVGPRLEHLRFASGVIGVPFEKVAKERQLNLLAIEFRRLRMKTDITQRVTVLASPAAMGPGPHHQDVRDAGILPLGPPIRLEGAEQILGIVPAADGHNGAVHILEMRPGVARLPIGVIVGMVQELNPLWRASLEQDLFRVGQRAHAQEKLVSIRCLVIERFGVFVQGILEFLAEAMEEPEILGEE